MCFNFCRVEVWRRDIVGRMSSEPFSGIELISAHGYAMPYSCVYINCYYFGFILNMYICIYKQVLQGAKEELTKGKDEHSDKVFCSVKLAWRHKIGFSYNYIIENLLV